MPKNQPSKIGEITEPQKSIDLSIGREIFSVGQKVTARSIPAKSMLLGIPKTLELAKYPSLIGVVLTIESFQAPWIVCTRPSGSYAPALTAEDLELWEVAPNVL